MSTQSRPKLIPSLTRSVMIWGVGDIYFIVSVVVAILFGMVAPDVQKQLHLSAREVGLGGSLFFLCYGIAQFVAGHLMDRLGPRLTLTASSLLASCGLFLFSQAESFSHVIVAQILSGIGLSTSYIGAIFLAGVWFSPDRFATISGITQMSANLLAVVATFAVVFSGALALGFQFIMGSLALVALCSALLLFLVVRGPVVSKSTTLWTDLNTLISIPQFWLGTIYFSTSFGVLLAFSNLWNIPDQLSYGYSVQTASLLNAMLPLGGSVGAFLSGWLASSTKRTSRVALVFCLGMFLVSCVLIYGPIFSTSVTFFLLALLGFFFGGAVLGFALVGRHIPAALKGTGFGLMATIAYILSAFLQFLVGALLGENAASPGSIAAIHHFKIALSPLVVTLFIGCVSSLWLRE